MELTKDDLLKMTATRVERVNLPGGGHTFVRTLPAGELDEWERKLTLPVRFKDKELRKRDQVMCRFVALVCCDESGNRRFTDAESGLIAKMRADVVKAIFNAGQELNDVDALADDTEKNSEADLGGSSASA